MNESREVPETVLDARQQRGLAALVEGRTYAEAAEAAGVDRRTIHRWRTSFPDFAAALAAAQSEALDAAEIRLGGLLRSALAAIEAVLSDASAPPAARLRAAELVLARTYDAAKARTPEAATAAPADVDRILAFMRWEQEQKGGQNADA